MKTARLPRVLVGCFAAVLRCLKVLYYRMAGISIGRNTFISLGAKLDTSGMGKIVIGDGCEIAHGCVILSHDAAVKRIDRKARRSGPVCVGDNVFLGANSVVLPSVTIGDNTVIGAGSVVTKDMPPNVVAVGSPARVIRQLPDSCELALSL